MSNIRQKKQNFKMMLQKLELLECDEARNVQFSMTSPNNKIWTANFPGFTSQKWGSCIRLQSILPLIELQQSGSPTL